MVVFCPAGCKRIDFRTLSVYSTTLSPACFRGFQSECIKRKNSGARTLGSDNTSQRPAKAFRGNHGTGVLVDAAAHLQVCSAFSSRSSFRDHGKAAAKILQSAAAVYHRRTKEITVVRGIVYVGYKTYISVKESTFLENKVPHQTRQSKKNLKAETLEENDEDKFENTQVDVNEGTAEITTITDIGEKTKQEANTTKETVVVSARSPDGKFVLGAIFLLLLPILTVFVFTILQSSWLSEIEIFEKYKNEFQNNQTIDLIVEWAIPWAMVCTAILVAAGIAFVIVTIYQCIKNEKLVHPQALFAVILEATLIAASPILKKIDAFNYLLEMMVDGGVINTLIALAVFYFAILTFLVLLFVPKADGKESFEKELRTKCTELFGRIQNVAVGLLDSSVRIIEFATTDSLKAILGMFDIRDRRESSNQKKN